MKCFFDCFNFKFIISQYQHRLTGWWKSAWFGSVMMGEKENRVEILWRHPQHYTTVAIDVTNAGIPIGTFTSNILTI